MRIVPLAFVAFAGLFALPGATPARADIGPPPSCAPGTHREYLYGHRCVADGSHLEADRDSGLAVTVLDKPSAVSPSSSAASPAPPSSSAAASPSAAKPAPPAKSGCSIALTGAREGTVPAFLALGSLLAFARRRRADRLRSRS